MAVPSCGIQPADPRNLPVLVFNLALTLTQPMLSQSARTVRGWSPLWGAAVLALSLFIAPNSSAKAQAIGDDTMGASASVLRPLAVIRTGNGNPNNMMVPGTSLSDQAHFDVTGEVGAEVSVTWAFPTQLAIAGGGEETLPLSGFMVEHLSGTTTDGNGDMAYTLASYEPDAGIPVNMLLLEPSDISFSNQFLRFMYTATAASDQKPGSYTGTVIVSVAYNEI